MDLPVTDPVLQFTMLVVAALVVELTLERVQLPGLLGLLLLGVLLGPGATDVLAREPMPDFLGHVGLVYLTGALFGYSGRERLMIMSLTLPQAAAGPLLTNVVGRRLAAEGGSADSRRIRPAEASGDVR